MNKVEEILFKTCNDRVADFKNKQKRLVHYTAAKNAFNILKENELWMGSVMDTTVRLNFIKIN